MARARFGICDHIVVCLARLIQYHPKHLVPGAFSHKNVPLGAFSHKKRNLFSHVFVSHSCPYLRERFKDFMPFFREFRERVGKEDPIVISCCIV